ncbi:NADH-quinone oxidoreductase subunit H [Halomonas sp. MCCC 1A17488]|uniref:NADH-quinone oxidoreductase subunit H n=1 Tax=Billgrantia sulfidoxydans TaxID=2733484 RepID=A0ABX7W302_9GAMM|nr:MULTISPECIES: NADH-quinone oxidoreductase subunit H [Halomonas]MCE8016365.1 NADH-quinone oxidoreductase subunit H [Halomonas sp. MCCC 1A17488]MCG3239698.1 NADH-quinone oxidoreductase subunit H [Halomonas sp. MCCC 1A17488]QPP50393.1 NADH-quinone oxidoreductase subunit H [Halomonas sp. SS10-MC5]QTP54012.1 NADH-quinone oxidoreductase subunit H [Halomonas sulfidoxydans]
MILDQLILPWLLAWLMAGLGAYLVAVLDRWMATGSTQAGSVWLAPLASAAWLLTQQATTTEAPDAGAWRLAPALYLALAATGLALVPWSPTLVGVDLATSLVLWGSLEALATVVIFLHGWSANSHLALIGAYRYVALGISYLLVSMFVLIGVALPAESLRWTEVVAAQESLWHVVSQPLGLPLFLVVGLGLTFWGPLDLADSTDLSTGTAVERSGPPRLVWALARAAMLVAFSAIAATAFLGGWMGPWLPGPAWLLLKSLAVLVVLLWLGRRLPRLAPERCLTLMWVVLLPLSFVDLIWAGAVALWMA